MIAETMSRLVVTVFVKIEKSEVYHDALAILGSFRTDTWNSLYVLLQLWPDNRSTKLRRMHIGNDCLPLA